MATTTFTKRQIVADLFPEFLTKRGQSLASVIDAYAEEVGVSRMARAYLATGWQLREGDAIGRARFGWRSPYSLKQDALVERHFADLARAGSRPATAGGSRPAAAR
jgi:hypothetical protein